MSAKSDEISDVLSRVVAETMECSPPDWSEGRLSIQADGVRINYQLKNEREPGKAVISEELRTLIDELYVRMHALGDPWIAAKITFKRTPAGASFTSDFRYATPAKVAPAPTPRPWWKVW